MHAIEKMLASASGNPVIHAGDIVTATVDMAEVNDLYLQVLKSFKELGGVKVAHSERVAFVFDHYSPAPTIKSADNQKKMREFCKEQGITRLYDVGEGICHQVLIEDGLVGPGRIIVESDSHTTTLGALGAFGTGVGSTDLAIILLTGKLWFRIPEVIKITLEGKLRPGVMAKDLVLHIIGELKQNAAIYKAVEFTGPVVSALPMDERLTLCNMMVEMGAKATYIQPDEVTYSYLKEHGWTEFPILETDRDYRYSEEHIFDVTLLKPQIALPGSVDYVADLSSHLGKHVDQVFIGTCTGGRYNDIAVAAKILKGKRVAPGVRMIVIPASKKILARLVDDGLFTDLLESGAVFSTPGCGPCLGAHAGVIAEGEICLSTSSRNFPGRMGSADAKVYLCSPATAAASALTGMIESAEVSC
ncbi:3-isopropylmalate dehydratase large subunit [Candidatus Bathyarchaeota archaeon]|nr:MAG: 3-isopropylmalate dehydratase large subunit [Candidatus Bathyarchaeota archaeon]